MMRWCCAALQTAAGMGITLIRSHTLGIHVGNALSFESALEKFNDSALDAADYALYRGAQLGIRFVVPLVDNWKYYHGGISTYTGWLGGLTQAEFYTDARAVTGELRIRHLSSHFH